MRINEWMYDKFAQNVYFHRLNEWYRWLVYLFKYTWERMYLGEHMKIDYLILNQYYEWINECIKFIEWDGDVIRLNEC